jgi:hypothetical protein
MTYPRAINVAFLDMLERAAPHDVVVNRAYQSFQKIVGIPWRRHENTILLQERCKTFSGTRLSKLERMAQTHGAHSLSVSTSVVSVELLVDSQNFWTRLVKEYV